MKMKKKVLLIGGGALVVLIIVLANVFSSGKKTTPVQAEKVGRKDITEQVSASGYIQPKTKVNITAEVNAKIIGVPVIEGEKVVRGQLLIQLDTVQLQKDVDQYSFSLHELESRTEAAKSQYLQAEDEHKRQQQLFERKLTSETAAKNAEYAYLNSKFNYEAMLSQTSQGKAAFEKAVDNLAKTKILAPMDGVITFVDVEVGEVAQAQTAFTQGKTLMIVSNLAAFEAEVDVDETEITKIKVDQPAKIEVDAFPDSVFNGEVIEIGNTAVQSNLGTQDQSTNFKVKILFAENNEHIRPGMSATVDIITNTRTKALSVPYGAIVMRSKEADSTVAKKEDSGGLINGAQAAAPVASGASQETKDKKDKEVKGVFVVKDNKAQFVPVETGVADQKDMEVTSGVAEGDIIITGPFKTLRTIKNGDDIKIEKQFKPEMIK